MAIFRCYQDAEEQANGKVNIMVRVFKTGDDPDVDAPIDHFTAVLEGSDVNDAFALPTTQERNARLKELLEQSQNGRIAKILVSEEAANNLNTTFTWPLDFTL